MKPLLVLDFDNVLHANGYERPDVVSGSPVPGAREFCRAALTEFDVLVVSVRCGEKGGSEAIGDWLAKYDFPVDVRVSEDGRKPAALVALDDRALTFDGNWPDVNDLLTFKPWNKT